MRLAFYPLKFPTSKECDIVIMAGKKSGGLKIPGLSFSWKRALGITQAKQKFARKTGIPTTKAGLERKVGKAVLDMLNPGSKSKKK